MCGTYLFLLFVLLLTSSSLQMSIFSIQPSMKYLIVPIDSLGLVNRLRLSSSAYALARHANMKLILVWASSHDCPCQFADLFLNTHSDIEIVQFNDTMSTTLPRELRSVVAKISLVHSLTVKELFVRKFMINCMFESDITIIWSRGSHSPDLATCFEYLQLKHKFYSGLVPSAPVADVIGGFYSRVSLSAITSVIGVHVRAFDLDHDWPVVVPSASTDWDSAAYNESMLKPGSSVAQRFDEVSTLNAFVDVLSHLISTSPGTVRFFLSSNSPAAKRALMHHFGPEVILAGLDDESEARVGDRTRLESLVVAAAEFWLLGQLSSELIVHSSGSSFAREAASVRGLAAVVDVSELPGGRFVHFHSLNRHLVDCAMPEYIRSSGNSTNDSCLLGKDSSSGGDCSDSVDEDAARWLKVCYSEDFGREMCTVRYAVCRCDIVSALGDCNGDTCSERDNSDRYSRDGGLFCSVTAQQYYSLLSAQQRRESCELLLAESNGYSI